MHIAARSIVILVFGNYAQDMLKGRTIHVCVSGGIAAYKSVEVVRLLAKSGARVRVAMTPNAQKFVGPLTFQAVTHAPVLTDTMDPSEEMEIGHIRFAQECDLILVVPATASCLGKAAAGIGDEVVSTVLLAANKPVIAAPAMNTYMFENPAVQANIQTLRTRGWTVLEPDSGMLACGYEGPGRLPEPERIADAARRIFEPKPLVGRSVVVTAGPTREFIDGVRFLSNPSTGRMGIAIAEAASAMGADVVLIHGPVSVPLPRTGVRSHAVTSAAEMRASVLAEVPHADAIVMTAAVADWTIERSSPEKMVKHDGPLTVSMVRTTDILAELGTNRTGNSPVLVGFAAETGDPRQRGQAKRKAKKVDLIIGNDVSAVGSGFATDTNVAHFVSEEGVESLPLMSKLELGRRIAQWLDNRFKALGAEEQP